MEQAAENEESAGGRWVQTPALLLAGCFTLCKLLDLSVTQCPPV